MDQPAVILPPKKRAALPNVFKRMAENPVILKELRGRMRGRRAFVLLTTYLVIISLFIGAIYAILAAQSDLSYVDPSFRQNFGKIIFSSVVLFEFLMIGFIGPALTAGAITSERERQTFDLLRTTLLSARDLVFGKLGSACMYLFLLVLTALPIEALAFILGGVGIEEILVSSLMLVVNIVFFCALGLFCSSFTKRTLTATTTSYSVILLSILGLGIITTAIGFYVATSNLNASTSPVFADILLIVLWLMACTNPFSAAIVSEVYLISNQALFLIKVPLMSNISNIYMPSPWILHIALYLALTALMIFLTILFVKRPDR
jgi:ABC-type transport system involved in multi-copper enzyme maturation permease subunit